MLGGITLSYYALHRYEAAGAANVGATLNANSDGIVLASLLNDKNFVDHILQGSHDVEMAAGHKGDPAARVCAIATICGALKCTFGGGMLNPVCVACSGTSLACAIATIGCWIADCGD